MPQAAGGTAVVLRGHLFSETAEGRPLETVLGLYEAYGITSVPTSLPYDTSTPFGADAVEVMDEAESLRDRITSEERLIHTRHLVTAYLVLSQQPALREVWKRLRDIGVTPRRYRDWVSGLAEGVPSTDQREAWRKVFQSVELEGSAALSPLFRQPPRAISYVNDQAGEKVSDRLGREGVIRSLATLLAWKDLKPPLALGIFGPWGSGKTFFMETMKTHIEALEATARHEESPTSCRRIVHIRFNAWHYNEANLWAGLVTRIFDGLRQALEDPAQPDKDSLEGLRGTLESTKEQLRSVSLQKEALDKRVQAEQEQFKSLQKEQEDARTSIRNLTTMKFWTKALEGPEVKALVESHLERLGFGATKSQLSSTMEAFAETQAELKTFWGVVNTLGRKLGLTNRDTQCGRIGLGHGVLVLCALAAIAAAYVVPGLRTWTDGLAECLARGLALLGAVALEFKAGVVYVRHLAEKGNDILGLVERTSSELCSSEMAALEGELRGLQQQASEAENNVHKAEEESGKS